MAFGFFDRKREEKCGQILSEKCDKMIGLLKELRDLMRDIKRDNTQILKLKYNQMRLEGKLERAMKEMGFDGDGDDTERKDQVVDVRGKTP